MLEPIYVNLASASEDASVTTIKSLCMQCQEMGETRLLMTDIPHYKHIVLMSFACEACSFRNSSVMPANWQEKGISYKLYVITPEDLCRQVVTSPYTTMEIPELELEIPSQTDKNGEITTVEGVIKKVVDNLKKSQEARREANIELADNIDNFIQRLETCLDLSVPFTLKVIDPSGNSYVESTSLSGDKQLIKNQFTNSSDNKLDIIEETLEENEQESIQNEEEEETVDNFNILKQEVLQFSTLCEKCTAPCDTNMKVINIPHFKEVILMATNCDRCGYRTNEVKSGGGVSECGKKVTLSIKSKNDLSRDVLKTDTCSILIPEVDLHVGSGILVGKFTTIEGLLGDIKRDLEKNPFIAGDSARNRGILQNILNLIDEVLNGSKCITIILDDPAGNVYVESFNSDPVNDAGLSIEEYKRTFDQNEELGLNDMKTENYCDCNEPEVKTDDT